MESTVRPLLNDNGDMTMEYGAHVGRSDAEGVFERQAVTSVGVLFLGGTSRYMTSFFFVAPSGFRRFFSELHAGRRAASFGFMGHPGPFSGEACGAE
jgi:hypothetical protein